MSRSADMKRCFLSLENPTNLNISFKIIRFYYFIGSLIAKVGLVVYSKLSSVTNVLLSPITIGIFIFDYPKLNKVNLKQNLCILLQTMKKMF